MALLVLALGAFMSICGIASIGYGSGIVADKDWVSVLVGVTALSGGFVTMALGAVVKTLLELRDAMRSGTLGVHAAGFEDSVAQQDDEIQAHAAPNEIASDAQPPLDTTRSTLMTPELESGMLAAILSSQDGHGHDAGVDHDRHSVVHAEEARSRHDEAAQPAFEPTDEATRFKVAFKGQPASEPPTPEPDGPAMDDWLDRAFSALDEDVPPAPAPQHHGDPGHSSDHELAHADLAPAPHARNLDAEALYPEAASLAPRYPEPGHPEPGHSEAGHSEARDDAMVAEAAVIGRYEADGTTYVMYADGSIEAQSEAGIYRFASMAELKSHIEGGN